MIELDPQDRRPLHRQIHDRVRDAVAAGRLRPGDRLPSIRALASALAVARGTVATAYELLIAEGYVETRGSAGSVITPKLAPRPADPPLTGAVAAWAPPAPLQLGVPALDAFPRGLWSRLGARRLRTMGPAALAYPDPAGYGPLRGAIALYLQLSRGVRCAPDQIFITQGYGEALAWIGRVLGLAGAAVWLEDPGYPAVRRWIDEIGARRVAVPVDGDGLVVAAGEALAPEARLAVVTPTHHSPLTLRLSAARRLALLNWAERAGSWIVEDDYDGEHHYQGPPPPALKALDAGERVIYAGTFSKALFPALRLAYLVVPPALTPLFRAGLGDFGGGAPWLSQAITADFMTEGHFIRHLKKMRTLYAQRRGWLRAAMIAACGDHLAFDASDGGMHLAARVTAATPGTDASYAARAQAAGLAVLAVSAWSERAPDQGVLMGFANVTDAAAAEGLARRLAAAIV